MAGAAFGDYVLFLHGSVLAIVPVMLLPLLLRSWMVVVKQAGGRCSGPLYLPAGTPKRQRRSSYMLSMPALV